MQDTLFTQAWEARVQGDFSQAEQLAETILTSADENAQPFKAIKAMKLLANLARDQGNLVQARLYYKKALDRHEGFSENCLSKAHTLRHLGSVCTALEDWEQAESYLREAIDLYETRCGQACEAVSELDMANAYRPLAIFMSQRGRKEEAIIWWEKATEYYVKAGIAMGQEEGEEALQQLRAS